MTIQLQEAKARLSELVEQIIRTGEPVTVSRRGTPVVEIRPISPVARRRRGGDLKGKIRVADDFDAPLADLAPYMEP